MKNFTKGQLSLKDSLKTIGGWYNNFFGKDGK